VEEAEGEGVGIAEAVGEAEGEGFATTFFCQTSLFPTFLHMREPDTVLTFEHFAPTLATDP
jgi:hypothetical protein